MSPFRPVVVKTRRGVVVGAVVAALVLPAATYLAGARVNKTVDATAQIQDERAASIRRNCLDVNARHDATIRQLDLLLAVRLRSTPRAQREQVRQNTAAFVLIVDAMVPKRDCARLVRVQVPSGRG